VLSCSILKIACTRPKLFIAPLVIFCFVYSNNNAAAQQKSFRVYTSNDGLVSNHIKAIFQDDDGFIWFASFGGITIYDGNHFTNYTAENGGISDNIVFGFFQRNKDETWVIESGATDVFIKRKYVKTIHINGYLLSNYLITNDGIVVAGREQTLYEIKDYKPVVTHVFNYNFAGIIAKIYQSGNYYLIESDSIYLTNKTFHIMSAIEGRLYTDSKKRIWLLNKDLHLLDTALLSRGILSFLPAPLTLRQLKITSTDIGDFLADRDGFYWILLETGAVLRIDSDGNPARFNFVVDNILPMRILEDAEGNIWLPGENGAVKFFSKHVDVFSIENGMPSDFIESIAYDHASNSVWAASKKGLTCIRHNRLYNIRYPTTDFSWSSVLLENDNLYLGLNGIYKYSIQYLPHPTLTIKKHWSLGKGLDDMVTCMQTDGHGNLFFNMENRGLFLAQQNGRVQKLHETGLWCFLIDGDELWTGAKEEGAAHWKIFYENDSVRLQIIQNYTDLSDDHVRTIVKDKDGNLWMGRLKKGIIKFENQGNGNYKIRSYSFMHGLSNGWVMKIIMTDNNMYIGTLGGVFKRLLIKDDSIRFDNISHKYGFISEVYDIVEGEKDNLWIAGDIGVLRIRNFLYRAGVPPKVHFTHLSVNNQADSSIFATTGNKQFSDRRNTLLFEFSSTSFRNEDHVLYSYALVKGNDPAVWSTPQNIHTVSLLSLSPGNYKFLVKAITQDNIESSHPAQYSFTISAPFWSTWWFTIIMILLIGLTVASFYRFRISQLRKVMYVRSKISRDLHDEIGSTLSGIGIMSELVKKQLENENFKAVENSVKKISAHSEEILGKMSDIVWAINPQNDTSEKMIQRLKHYARNMAMPLNINVTFEVEGAEQINLGMQERNNIYLICKEAINNTIKYSRCSNLDVFFKVTDHQLLIEIRDNGAGFESGNGHEGNGLGNMKTRAKEIDALLTVISECEKGTIVKLTYKIT
jgi:two-component sensor histidine kinase